jgi:PAS domain S-box-containing protein
MRESKEKGGQAEQAHKSGREPSRSEPLRPQAQRAGTLRHTEQTSSKSEEMFRSIFETGLIGVAICSPDKKWLYVNDRICKILGYSREELCQTTWDKLTHPDDLEADVSQFNRLLAGEIDNYGLEKRFIRKDGSVVHARIYISCRRNQDGVVEYDIGLLEDITERKAIEERLLKYQKQLKRLAAQLALAEERERRRIAGELHDQVTQSLALAKIKLDALRATVSSQSLAGAIESVIGSIEKAIQDTRSLTFDLSSPILHELGFEAAVAEWLDEQVRNKHGIATEFQDDDRPKQLDDDVRTILFRNVRELLINVIKHARAGRVNVCIRRVDGFIEVAVEDDGVGFDPLETRTMAARAAKFGLFSVRESIEQLGGYFEIASRPGAGCKAIMRAPLKRESHKNEK